jgi:hypothetical protein
MDRPKATFKDNEEITPLILAERIRENPEVLLRELKEEKGIFEDAMKEETILAWDTVQRACERRGIEILSGGEAPSKSQGLTDDEQRILEYCADFHRDYAKHIENTVPISSASRRELAGFHRDKIGGTIDRILEKIREHSRSQSLSDPSAAGPGM